MAPNDQPPGSGDAQPALGRIQLKRVAVSSGGGPAVGGAAAAARSGKAGASRPMNRLVPYLDLFARLSDGELSRLAQVPVSVASELRAQVDEICGALSRYVDLLPRLSDEELVRLTGATPKTIRFWRLCQPRQPGAPEPADTQISSPWDVDPASSSSSDMSREQVAGAEGSPEDEIHLEVQE